MCGIILQNHFFFTGGKFFIALKIAIVKFEDHCFNTNESSHNIFLQHFKCKMHKAEMIRQMMEFEAQFFLVSECLLYCICCCKHCILFNYSLHHDAEFSTGKKMVLQICPAHDVEVLFWRVNKPTFFFSIQVLARI